MALTATLKRFVSDKQGTFGTLTLVRDGHELSLCTGELPWIRNQRRVSCIPNGTYQCHMAYSPKFDRELWHVDDVFNRTDVLIHVGNYCGDVASGLATDTQGCILVGTAHAVVGDVRIVSKSKDGFAQLMKFTAGAPEMWLSIQGLGIPDAQDVRATMDARMAQIQQEKV